MPPTSPSHDDPLDLDGLDLKPSGAKKAAAAESDFEKELEALFAEELASSDEKPATAPPVGAPEPEEETLLLDDLVEDAPTAPLAEPVAAPLAAPAEVEEEDILDLGAFGDGGELELSPPEDTAGGKDGVIDLSGLDEIISGLGDAKAEPAAAVEPAAAPLDGTDMADLLENLDVPAAPVAAEPAPEAGEDLLELSLGDLVEEATAIAPVELEAPAAPEESVLDLTLPDFSEPEPGRDLVAEQEHADMGGELNLSLDDLVAAEPAPAPAEASMDQMLGEDLGMGGLMEGIESSDGEPAPEISLDAEQLLAQIPDAALEAAMAAAIPPVSVPEETLGETALLEPEAPEFEAQAEEAAEPEPELLAPIAPEDELLEASLTAAEAEEPAPLEVPSALADAALAGAVAGAVTTAASAPAAMDDAALAALNERLAQLATQVTGNSVAVVRLEGKLAEREKNLAELEERLKASQEEAQALREELAALRSNMEESLRTQDEAVQQELAQAAQAAADKSQAAMEKALGAVDKALAALDKAQMAADKADSLAPRVESAEMTVRGAGARLTQMENRQSQLDREVFAEITRAVPREAAKVIREEIAHLAASMRDE
jgi:hypothetical protein